MDIHKGIEIIDLGLYLKEDQTLIIGDIHLGYEQYMAKKGVLVPRTQYKDTVARLDRILKKCNPKKIVLNGDVKHEFGSVNPQEWRETLKFLKHIEQKRKQIVVIKGNHDVSLFPILRKTQVEEQREYITGEIQVVHGDYIPEKLKPVIIIGHEHPAISLREGGKIEKYKCFLKGKFRKSVLIVMPSFLTLTAGTDITKEKTLSPLIKKIENFECFTVGDDEVYYFGKVKNLLLSE